MEEGKTYPFIDYIYGGMQIANVPKAFTWKTANGREIFGGLQEYAQLGIAGIILDGLGTPCRGRKIHDVSYENIHMPARFRSRKGKSALICSSVRSRSSQASA